MALAVLPFSDSGIRVQGVGFGMSVSGLRFQGRGMTALRDPEITQPSGTCA